MGELLLLHKRIDIDASPVLYEKPFTPESLAADWEICGGEWHCEDGALLGRHPGPFAFLFSRADFPGNVLLDFHAATVAPSTHDIDVFWNATHDPPRPAAAAPPMSRASRDGGTARSASKNRRTINSW